MANQTSGKDGKGRELVCSFCGRTQNEVEQLIIGPGVNICKDCLDMCNNALYKDGERPAPPRAGMPPRDRRRQAQKPGADYGADPLESIHILTPAEIKAGLDQYVIGQDAAKRALSVAVYNHYKRICCGDGDDVSQEPCDRCLRVVCEQRNQQQDTDQQVIHPLVAEQRCHRIAR